MLRRRGDELRTAVFQAAIAEITEVGLNRVTMDAIAHRAGTGKAALYRRWPNARALLVDVTTEVMAAMRLPTDTSSGSLRTDLVAIGSALAAFLNSPDGPILRELFAEASRDPALLAELDARYRIPVEAQMAVLVDQAIRRGDIPRQQVDPLVLMLVSATVLNIWLIHGRAPEVSVVEHVVDSIVMPLLGAPAGTAAELGFLTPLQPPRD